MADLTIQINEKIILDGTDRGVLTTQTISNINNIDNRILTCPSGSYTGLFLFNPSNIDAATFSTGSFKYGRVTNRSAVPVKLLVQTNGNSNYTFLINPSSTFFLSNTSTSGSALSSGSFTFNDYINEIQVQPSGSSATIEYFIATT
jgi:predicted outer membrane repeat protein